MVLGIAFVGMQGNLDFMRKGFNHALGFRQKGAIGGEHGHKVFPTGHPNDFRQMGMQEGLSHQVKIKELDLSTKFISQRLELFQGKTMLGSIRLGTEQAIQIADIGYFKLAAGNHRQYILTKKSFVMKSFFLVIRLGSVFISL